MLSCTYVCTYVCPINSAVFSAVLVRSDLEMAHEAKMEELRKKGLTDVEHARAELQQELAQRTSKVCNIRLYYHIY